MLTSKTWLVAGYLKIWNNDKPYTTHILGWSDKLGSFIQLKMAQLIYNRILAPNFISWPTKFNINSFYITRVCFETANLILASAINETDHNCLQTSAEAYYSAMIVGFFRLLASLLLSNLLLRWSFWRNLIF